MLRKRDLLALIVIFEIFVPFLMLCRWWWCPLLSQTGACCPLNLHSPEQSLSTGPSTSRATGQEPPVGHICRTLPALTRGGSGLTITRWHCMALGGSGGGQRASWPGSCMHAFTVVSGEQRLCNHAGNPRSKHEAFSHFSNRDLVSDFILQWS